MKNAIASGDEQTVDPPNPSTGSDTASPRRRLLLGTAALLPSVLTLSSGAQAAVSSSARCWDRVRHQTRGDFSGAGGLEEDTPRFAPSSDEWLRKRVYTGMSGGRPAFCAMTDQASCMNPDDRTKAATGSVWMVDGNRVVVGPGIVIDQVSPSHQAYGLVFVNQDATVATLDPGQFQDLRPVKVPCWNSLIGGRATHLG